MLEIADINYSNLNLNIYIRTKLSESFQNFEMANVKAFWPFTFTIYDYFVSTVKITVLAFVLRA